MMNLLKGTIKIKTWFFNTYFSPNFVYKFDVLITDIWLNGKCERMNIDFISKALKQLVKDISC